MSAEAGMGAKVRRRIRCGILIACGWSGEGGSAEIEIPLAPVKETQAYALSSDDELKFKETLRALMSSSVRGGLDTASNPALRSYLTESVAHPGVFWGLVHEGTSQQILLEQLHRLRRHPKEGYQVCLRFRWLTPTFNQFAPACEALGDTLAKENPNDMATLWGHLSPSPQLRVLTVDDSLQALIASYRNHPYSQGRLRRVIQSLSANGYADVAKLLLGELEQLNPEFLWNTERGGIYQDLLDLFNGKEPESPSPSAK